MKKSVIQHVPEYYEGYINQTPERPLLDALQNGGIDLFEENLDLLEKLGDQVYAPGKSTVKQMVEHLMDTERIFVARSLRFARNDKTELPGYDHDLYVANARSNEFDLELLL